MKLNPNRDFFFSVENIRKHIVRFKALKTYVFYVSFLSLVRCPLLTTPHHSSSHATNAFTFQNEWPDALSRPARLGGPGPVPLETRERK